MTNLGLDDSLYRAKHESNNCLLCLTIMIKELRALHQLTCEKLCLEARAILQHNGCSVVQEFSAKFLSERCFMA